MHSIGFSLSSPGLGNKKGRVFCNVTLHIVKYIDLNLAGSAWKLLSSLTPWAGHTLTAISSNTFFDDLRYISSPVTPITFNPPSALAYIAVRSSDAVHIPYLAFLQTSSLYLLTSLRLNSALMVCFSMFTQNPICLGLISGLIASCACSPFSVLWNAIAVCALATYRAVVLHLAEHFGEMRTRRSISRGAA